MEKVLAFLEKKGLKHAELPDGLGYAFETEQYNCFVRITGPYEYRVNGTRKGDATDWFSCSLLPSQNHVIDKIKERAMEVA